MYNTHHDRLGNQEQPTSSSTCSCQAMLTGGHGWSVGFVDAQANDLRGQRLGEWTHQGPHLAHGETGRLSHCPLILGRWGHDVQQSCAVLKTVDQTHV